jgi:putative sigma-54 modulation protein
VVEIKIHIPKQECFVKASANSFQTAFDQAFDSITNQLKKKKEHIAA